MIPMVNEMKGKKKGKKKRERRGEGGGEENTSCNPGIPGISQPWKRGGQKREKKKKDRKVTLLLPTRVPP